MTDVLPWLVIGVPLAMSFVLLLGSRALDPVAPWLGVLASATSAVLGVVLFVDLLGRPAEDRSVTSATFEWIPAGSFQLSAGLLVDPLSIAFVLLITVVGTLIHVYSVEYMRHDASKRRFFAYLNLFVAAMLLLVLADSFLLLFIGWEGVGLASYLLIGFWNHRPDYARAANKAFVVNRVGDFGLALAIMAMFAAFGTVTYSGVFGAVEDASEGWLTAIGLLLVLGAAGKSAQFPLQSWLLDAMAGPTPVSALIHAATMVTAGVYLVVRAGPIFEGAPVAALTVAIVGAITLVMGAVIGTVKDDIKRALAASTMSQIGYMMLAAGLGPAGYVFAIFHLLTHGFFKAGMFLGAGSVMHGMDDQVDMRRFGRLDSVMRVTWATFAVGWLAILGVPPFSGFWSKDGIIEVAFEGEGARPWILGSVALLGAGITAYYMSRLFFMTFHGRARWSEEGEHAVHPHESPWLMTVPMIVLAVGSAGLGWYLYAGKRFETWLEPVVGTHTPEPHVLPVPWIIGLTLAAVAVGLVIAARNYAVQPVPVTAPATHALGRAARADLYQDDVNEVAVVAPTRAFARGLREVEDDYLAGGVRGLARGVGAIGAGWGRLQTGFARSYALSMLGGVVLVVGALLVVRL
ncbi:MAG: NADH-quinone oxidoreductase subunit L [Kineosporiaceae bacterium]